MGLFSTTLDSFDTLFVDQLEDLYDAETRLTSALPKMASAASSERLRTAFEQHLRETENHISRLEQVFKSLSKSPQRKTCEAMKGLITEGSEAISATGDPDVKDAALIAAAQRVEHYEIAGYGTARAFARRLGHHDAEELLAQTLHEEEATDRKLTDIAEESVNADAVRS